MVGGRKVWESHFRQPECQIQLRWLNLSCLVKRKWQRNDHINIPHTSGGEVILLKYNLYENVPQRRVLQMQGYEGYQMS